MNVAQPIRRTLSRPDRPRAFTLIELLVVISIIALMIGILLPALGAARGTARGVASLSNLRQIGIALAAYSTEQKDYLPMHSSSVSSANRIMGTKPRWADYMNEYMKTPEVFLSPNLDAHEREQNFMALMWHSVSSTPAAIAAADHDGDGASDGGTALANPDPVYQGGYGYNFQYLGNARFNPTFHARMGREVLAASDTVAVGDVAGSRGGNASAQPGDGGTAVYSLDPPLGSDRGAHPTYRAYYVSGPEENTGTYDEDHLWLTRSAPAPRNQGQVANFTFADGHAAASSLRDIDDSDGDGTADNGLWNGLGDATRR